MSYHWRYLVLHSEALNQNKLLFHTAEHKANLDNLAQQSLFHAAETYNIVACEMQSSEHQALRDEQRQAGQNQPARTSRYYVERITYRQILLLRKRRYIPLNRKAIALNRDADNTERREINIFEIYLDADKGGTIGKWGIS